MSQSANNKTFRILCCAIGLNVFVAGMLILLGGLWPKTTIGWVIVLVLGGPMWLFGEYIGDKIFGEKMSKMIDNSEKTVSLARIVYGVIVMAIIFAVTIGAQHYFKGFLTKHFIPWHLTTG